MYWIMLLVLEGIFIYKSKHVCSSEINFLSYVLICYDLSETLLSTELPNVFMIHNSNFKKI